MKKPSKIVFIIFIVLFAGFYYYSNIIEPNSANDENDWEVLFNGKNLDGWEIKIRG